MSGQAEKIIKPESFGAVSDDINKVAEMLRAATSNLRASYIYESKNSEVQTLRTNVFNNAMIYKSKILPFTDITITSIKDFCNMIKSHKYDDFKKNLEKIIIKNTSKNEKYCEFTCLFHFTILTDFKKVENEIIKSRLKQILDNNVEKTTSNFMPSGIPGFTIDSFETTLYNTDQKHQDSPRNVLELLTVSISNYIKSLENISGFFRNLHSDLTALKDYSNEMNTNDDEDECFMYYNMIISNVNTIFDACKGYFNLEGTISSNLDCINEVPDHIYIEGWILRVVQEKGRKEDLQKLIAPKKELKKICGFS